jgi:hypothetical protein
MSVVAINLDAAMIGRLTEDPALYVEVPFLLPMKDSALSIHKKLPSNCSTCQKNARRRALKSLASAFQRLTLDGSKRSAADSLKLRSYIIRRFNLPSGTPITLQYTDERGQSAVFII